jgi:SPP1 family phage portal protein
VVISDLYDDLIKTASLDGITWLHFYIENNKLDWIIVRDAEIIVIKDRYKKNIVTIIRYYFIDKDTIKIEEWTLTGLVTYTIRKDKVFDLEETTHFSSEIIYDDEVIETKFGNFPFIPFLPLKNNKEEESDISGIKILLDYYNDISSGFIDNVYKFQEAIIKLKGFSGDVDTLDQTLKKLKKYKMVGVPNDGDLEYMAIEIPVEARKVLLDILKENIFKLGRAYDPDLIGDGNITNIVIKSRYFQLDNKCNKLEKQLKLFHESFIKFIGGSDYDIEFNRTQLFNESEKLLDCVNAIDLVNAGLLSRRTLIGQIPYVNNVDDELKLIEAEKPIDNNMGQNPPNETQGQNPV